jgi:hypothetical protein
MFFWIKIFSFLYFFWIFAIYVQNSENETVFHSYTNPGHIISVFVNLESGWNSGSYVYNGIWLYSSQQLWQTIVWSSGINRHILDNQPIKYTNLFPIYLYYSITLNTPTCFSPQGTTIRESNWSNSAQNQTSHFCTQLTCKRVRWLKCIHFFVE